MSEGRYIALKPAAVDDHPSRDHTHKIRVVGFFDQAWKWAGTKQIARFRPEDYVVLDHIPTQEWPREYAVSKGYYPSEKDSFRCVPGKCEPVYELIDHHPPFVWCEVCQPLAWEIIDNRNAPAA